MFAIRPGDPDSEGMQPGKEVCPLPAGVRIPLYDSPRTSSETPDFIHVSLLQSVEGCELQDGWVYRANVSRNSAERSRESGYSVRIRQGAVLKSESGARDERSRDSSCQLPADKTIFLEKAPVWSAGSPGDIQVTFLDPVLGCSLRSGSIDSQDLDLTHSSAPEREYFRSVRPQEEQHWVMTGPEETILRIKDLPESSLEPGTGRCALPPNTRYALKQAPGVYSEEVFHFYFATVPEGCKFDFGYVTRKNLAAVSLVSGLPLSDNRNLQGTEEGFWFQMGDKDGALRIRADVAEDSLEPVTGKCMLRAKARYWVRRTPSHHDEKTLNLYFTEPIPGCRFDFGYVARSLIAGSSPIAGIPPIGGGLIDPILSVIKASAESYAGKGVFEVGCPRDYRRGSGSVCCARLVSMVLKRAKVKFQPSDNVNELVRNLKRAGWTQVPAANAPVGSVIFHDKTPNAYGSQHVGVCATTGCASAWNSWQQRFLLNKYPSMNLYSPYIQRGGAWGGALVPPKG